MRDAKQYEDVIRDVLKEDVGASPDDDEELAEAFREFVERLMEIDGGAPNPYIIDGLGSTGEEGADEDYEEEDYEDEGGDEDAGEEPAGDSDDDSGDGAGDDGPDDDDGDDGDEAGDNDGSVKDDGGDKPPSGDFRKDAGKVSDARMKRAARRDSGESEGDSQRTIAAALKDLRF